MELTDYENDNDKLETIVEDQPINKDIIELLKNIFTVNVLRNNYIVQWYVYENYTLEERHEILGIELYEVYKPKDYYSNIQDKINTVLFDFKYILLYNSDLTRVYLECLDEGHGELLRLEFERYLSSLPYGYIFNFNASKDIINTYYEDVIKSNHTDNELFDKIMNDGRIDENIKSTFPAMRFISRTYYTTINLEELMYVINNYDIDFNYTSVYVDNIFDNYGEEVLYTVLRLLLENENILSNVFTFNKEVSNIIVNILEEKDYNMIELLTNMDNNIHHTSIYDSVIDRIDKINMGKLISIYKKGQGNTHFRQWIEKTIINQV